MYDDPVNTARRLLTIHKDQPWARGELADLVPLLLNEIEKLESKIEDMTPSWQKLKMYSNDE